MEPVRDLADDLNYLSSTPVELSDNEERLLLSLPKPPPDGYVRKPGVVWIVEWLPADEQPTGKQLHEWISKHGRIDSRYFVCKTKKDVITTCSGPQ